MFPTLVSQWMVYVHSFPKSKARLRDWLRNMKSAVEDRLPQQALGVGRFEERVCVISPSVARSVDIQSVRLTENDIPAIFDKLSDAKRKRISSLMEKLNRKRVCNPQMVYHARCFTATFVHKVG